MLQSRSYSQVKGTRGCTGGRCIRGHDSRLPGQDCSEVKIDMQADGRR